MQSFGPGKTKRKHIRRCLSIVAAVVTGVVLFMPQCWGLVLGFMARAALVVSLLALLCRCRWLKWLGNQYVSIVLIVVVMDVMREWEINKYRSYAAEIGESLLVGRELAPLLDGPPWVVRINCLGRWDWLRNEVLSMVNDWSLFEAAVRNQDDVVANKKLTEICGRRDVLKNGWSFGMSGKIVSQIAGKVRYRGLMDAGAVCSGVVRRAEMLSAMKSGQDSCRVRGSSVDVAAYTNLMEYVAELCRLGGVVNPEDVGLMKDEWIFVVGVPESVPDTFPVMISSNLNPAVLPRVNQGGTNFCGYVKTGCDPRCGSGRIVVVTKSGALRVARCQDMVKVGSDDDLTYFFNLRDVVGSESYKINEDTYYLTPAGKVGPCGRE